MKDPAIKHSAIKHMSSLETFSRDHGVELACAEAARKAVRASKAEQAELIQKIRSTCHDAILGYLEDEQWILSPLIGEDGIRATFHQKQKNIRRVLDELDTLDLSKHRGIGLLSMLADALDDYVRWVEHSLFLGIEQGMESKQLHHLTQQTTIIEASRARPTQRLHRSVSVKTTDREGSSVVHSCS